MIYFNYEGGNFMNKEKQLTREWCVIFEYDYIPELDAYPLYEFLGDGLVKENPGRKRPDKVLFYNVTSADDDFKRKYSSIIHELEIKNVEEISIVKDEKPYDRKGKIEVAITVPSETYKNLSKQEKKMLGYDFCTMEQKEDGIEFKPLVTSKEALPEVLYLRIHPENLSDELNAKISSETFELVKLENGLYSLADYTSKEKEM